MIYASFVVGVAYIPRPDALPLRMAQDKIPENHAQYMTLSNTPPATPVVGENVQSKWRSKAISRWHVLSFFLGLASVSRRLARC